MRRRWTRELVLLLPLWACALPVAAQIDPERRQLAQVGFDHSLDGRGPLAAYAYYYLNAPRFLKPRQTLRLTVAPGYFDSELGFAQVLGPKTDVGIGLAGGAFADSHAEIRQGRYHSGESFRGDGAKVAGGLYHDFPAYGRVPIAGILRVEGHYAKFTGDKKTEPAFVVPGSLSEFSTRAGIRIGGKEPLLRPLPSFADVLRPLWGPPDRAGLPTVLGPRPALLQRTDLRRPFRDEARGRDEPPRGPLQRL